MTNEFFRFFDTRAAQSVTLSGRVVTKHMIRKANEIVAGEYAFGEDILASDTDSCYLSISKLVRAAAEEAGIDIPTITKETDLSDAFIDQIVGLADAIGGEINDSFPDKMVEMFFVDREHGAIIKAGREVVASRGLFNDKKKRYALAVIDKEHIRKHDLKVMGMESQRTDTPKFIQDFLKKCLESVVQDGKDAEALSELIAEFRQGFKDMDPWKLGKPGRVSNLTIGARQRAMWEFGEDPDQKATQSDEDDDDILPTKRIKMDNPKVYYFIIGCDNTNRYIDFFDDQIMDKIQDGDKVELLDLFTNDPKRNPLNFKTIAIPVDAKHVPDWFKDMPFDVGTMETKLIDKKIDNIFGVLKWDLNPKKTVGDSIFV